ncbi:MAG: methyltransferase domain-containing protein [Steroidobacteraceae bacterium]
MMPFSRREALRFAASIATVTAFIRHLPGEVAGAATATSPATANADANNAWSVAGSSNFKAIYGDTRLRDAFLLFLTNVYHLYPEGEFQALIADAARKGHSDREVYALVQAKLDKLKPFLADIRYALPALARQKEEMTRETLALLGSRRQINGFMEIGSTGRYLGHLRGRTKMTGDLVLLNNVAPSYSPLDIVERGGLHKRGRFVSLNDYAPISPAQLADDSLDVVANYIGFHHSPPRKRDAFVRSVQRVLRPGGRLILRDHNVDSDEMNRMVALAHDVFNMGLEVPWQKNQSEIRNFTSLDQIIRALDAQGLRRTATSKPLFQSGDPTRNALIEFVKV